MLGLLQARAVIEQAKGAIMLTVVCRPERAWHILRDASQAHDVTLRDIAIALVELCSRTLARTEEATLNR